MNELVTRIRTQLSRYYEPGEAAALTFYLLERRYGLTRTQLYMGKGRHFSPNEEQELREILDRLCKKEPIQYVLGDAEFCGHLFRVTPAVLIPRPETEELVQWILREESHARRLLDIGTGSGCIALSLAAELPGAEVEGWDISPDALAVAGENARRLKLPVRFAEHDILNEQPEGRWEVVVSNPPYITPSEQAEMETNVLDYEPHLALFVPQQDPLLFYRAIARYAARHLVPGGKLYFEINRAYGEETVRLLRETGYTHVELRHDAYDNPRMVSARWQESETQE
jgi:release factor glutamine methyltransferase